MERSVGKKLALLAENVANQEYARTWLTAFDQVRATLRLEPYDYAKEVSPNIRDATVRVQTQVEDAEFKLAVANVKTAQLNDRLIQEQAELAKMSESVQTTGDYAKQLEDDLEEAEAARKQLQAQLAELQPGSVPGPGVSGAQPAPLVPTDRNRTKLFVVTMFLGCTLCTGLLFVRSFSRITTVLSATQYANRSALIARSSSACHAYARRAALVVGVPT